VQQKEDSVMAKPRSVELSNPFLDNLEGVCELLLVRHGEQQYERDMTIAAGVNPPLSQLGQRQAAAVGERLANHKIDVVYASPLTRAFDTGNAIAQHHGLDPIVDDDLQEVDLWGKIDQSKSLKENLPADEIRAIFRESQRSQSWDAYIYGNGAQAFRDRVHRAIERIAAEHVGQRVVVACHGGVIGTYLSQLWGADFDNVCHVHHTSISTVRTMDEYRRVIAVNDFRHVLPFQNSINELNAN
jgi:probable phosphoglycerate mutase